MKDIEESAEEQAHAHDNAHRDEADDWSQYAGGAVDDAASEPGTAQACSHGFQFGRCPEGC